MARVHNFNAGPAGLPLAALERAQRELLDFEGTGMSIMEHSHRGKAYEAVHDEAVSLLRELCGLPDDMHVLFLQGGASLEFARVPMNFLRPDASADYVVTGGWSEKALEEAKRIGNARVAATTVKDKKYTRIPRQAELELDPGAAYVHYTTNNTLFGTQWHWVPEVGEVPLVADMSSDFLWKPLDAARYSLIYAGAQKNIGPSGVTVVLVKKAFLERARTDIPVILRYATHAANNSLYNTPPTFGIYLVRNVLALVKEAGGPRRDGGAQPRQGRAALRRPRRDERLLRGARRAREPLVHERRLPPAERRAREAFVAEAAKQGMVGLAGHRSTGRRARLDLQRGLARVGRGPRRVHARVPQERLT
jgi:phosphoserine aminotransferase